MAQLPDETGSEAPMERGSVGGHARGDSVPEQVASSGDLTPGATNRSSVEANTGSGMGSTPTPAPPRNTLRQRFSDSTAVKVGAIATVLALIVGLPSAYLAVQSLRSDSPGSQGISPAPPEPSIAPPSGTTASVSFGNFEMPMPDQEVISPLDVSGRATVSGGEALWLLSKPPNGNYYTTTSDPAPVDVDARGDWIIQEVGLGKGENDMNEPFELVLVAAPREGSVIEDSVDNRGDRMSADLGKQLPEDTRELDRVTVRLTGYE